MMRLSLLLIILTLQIFSCRSTKKSQYTSGLKDLSDGSNWCHAKFKSTDNTNISVDFNVSSGHANPVWINVSRSQKDTEIVEAIVVPYSYPYSTSHNWNGQVGSSFNQPLDPVSGENRFTGKINSGLLLVDQSAGKRYYYEFAFKLKSGNRESYLVDPITNSHNFKADLMDVTKNNRYTCGGKPSTLTPVTSDNKQESFDVETIANATKQIFQTFYRGVSEYTQSISGTPPPDNEPGKCYSACPSGRWPRVSCLYYCQLPSYSAVTPNIRGCFSTVVRGSIPFADGSAARPLTYPEAYDYCVFQEYEVVLKKVPPFDPQLISKNKATGNKPGPMKWVDDNQADIFKYLMFSTGVKNPFNAADESAVIESYNKITAPSSVFK